jgi:hypothetical protein
MSIIAIVVMILICSVLMYSFESREQPEVFSNGFSGVSYVWLSILNEKTDIEPLTTIGQALSTLMVLLGGCMIGVPVAIIATGFEDMIAEQAGDEGEDTEIYETLRLYDSMSESDRERFRKIISLEEEKRENQDGE